MLNDVIPAINVQKTVWFIGNYRCLQFVVAIVLSALDFSLCCGSFSILSKFSIPGNISERKSAALLRRRSECRRKLSNTRKINREFTVICVLGQPVPFFCPCMLMSALQKASSELSNHIELWAVMTPLPINKRCGDCVWTNRLLLRRTKDTDDSQHVCNGTENAAV